MPCQPQPMGRLIRRTRCLSWRRRRRRRRRTREYANPVAYHAVRSFCRRNVDGTYKVCSSMGALQECRARYFILSGGRKDDSPARACPGSNFIGPPSLLLRAPPFITTCSPRFLLYLFEPPMHSTPLDRVCRELILHEKQWANNRKRNRGARSFVRSFAGRRTFDCASCYRTAASDYV